MYPEIWLQVRNLLFRRWRGGPFSGSLVQLARIDDWTLKNDALDKDFLASTMGNYITSRPAGSPRFWIYFQPG